jgi:hypothetical protein
VLPDMRVVCAAPVVESFVWHESDNLFFAASGFSEDNWGFVNIFSRFPVSFVPRRCVLGGLQRF